MLLLCYIKNVTLQISGGAAVSAAPTKQILGGALVSSAPTKQSVHPLSYTPHHFNIQSNWNRKNQRKQTLNASGRFGS